MYAPPASVLQRRDSPNCLIHAFNGKSRVWRRENNANRQSKLHFQAVCPGAEAQLEGEEKGIYAALLDCVSAGEQGPVWERWRQNNTFPEFSRRQWHFLERERGVFSFLVPLPSCPFSSSPPPEAPRACLWHPRSHCPGSPGGCQPLNFLSLSSFASRQRQGEPEELLGPRGGGLGAYTCV